MPDVVAATQEKVLEALGQSLPNRRLVDHILMSGERRQLGFVAMGVEFSNGTEGNPGGAPVMVEKVFVSDRVKIDVDNGIADGLVLHMAPHGVGCKDFIVQPLRRQIDL